MRVGKRRERKSAKLFSKETAAYQVLGIRVDLLLRVDNPSVRTVLDEITRCVVGAAAAAGVRVGVRVGVPFGVGVDAHETHLSPLSC